MKLKNVDGSNSEIRNFFQGKLWEKRKQQFNGKSIPMFLYTDDFETNNVLGSHSGVQSVTAFYYSFPNIKNASKLRTIFVAALYKSSHIKSYGNEKVLKELINELISLQNEGIDFILNGELVKTTWE